MHPRRHIPIPIALLANAILGLILIEANHYLSGFSLQAIIPASFVLYAGLCMSYLPGLFVCIVSGLMMDASIPTPPGYFLITLPILQLVIHRLRPKLHREGGLDSILITQFLNLLVLLHLSFLYHQQAPIPLFLSFIQILTSQTLLLVILPTHLAIQIALSSALGIDVNEEEAKSA
jgi:small basic protein